MEQLLQQLRQYFPDTFTDDELNRLATLGEQPLAELVELHERFRAELEPRARQLREQVEAHNLDGVEERMAEAESLSAAVTAVRAESDRRPNPAQLLASIEQRLGQTDAEANPAPEGTVRRFSAATPQQRAAVARRMPVSPQRDVPSSSFAPNGSLVAAAGGDDARELVDVEALGRLFNDEWNTVKGIRGDFKRAVARLHLAYPNDRRLGDSPTLNTERLMAVAASARTGAEAIVAAGGLCAPVAARYEIQTISEDHRPIRDALPRFNADRGGVRFIRPPTLANVASGVDVITEAEDTAGATKSAVTVTCGTEVEELVSAVYAYMTFGNFYQLYWAEGVAANLRVLMAQHAREAETELWDQMVTDSTAVTAGEQLGAARDILENLDQAAVAYRSRHRMPRNAPIRVIGPDWAMGLMRADLVRQMPGDDTYGVSEARVMQWFAARDIVLTLSPDVQVFGTQGATPLLRWPDTIEFLLFSEGSTFAFLDGGDLNLGFVRDSTLNQQNQVQWFSETFENVARFGYESLRLTLNVCPDGTASALTDINPCTSGS